VEGLENDKAAQQLEIVKLKARVKKLEKINKVKSSKLRRLKKDEGIELVTDQEKDAEVEGRHAAKRRKLSEEAQEADDLRKRLEIVQDEDDDVFFEATPPAQKSNVDAASLKLKLFKDAAPIAHAKMGDEHLDTISETETNEFIKSSVENLVPSPSESKDLSDNKCDLPLCNNFTTFSNVLFDADDDFTSSDNESFSNKDIPKEIYSYPLFDEEIISIRIDLHHLNAESDLIESQLNQDSSIISSSKIDSLLDEFGGELILLKSIPPGIDEADCDPKEEVCLIEKLLYDNSSLRPPKEFISENSDATNKSFSPSPILVEDSDSLRDEIDLSLSSDDSMPSSIEEYDYDSEGDIHILKELLSNDSLLLPENETFHFDIPSSPRPPAKPLDDDEIDPNLGILTIKVVGDISKHYVPMPRLLPT
nr:hypothetical protein [Tanacetum cinerariifolium]